VYQVDKPSIELLPALFRLKENFMKRHTSAYIFIALFIGLTTISMLFGSLPLTAATTSAPAGLTETFTPTATPALTETPTPTETLAPTNTPTPIDTVTPTAMPASTNTPAPTDVSTVAATVVVTVSTETPTAPAVVGFPDTGGNPKEGDTPSWIFLLAAAFVIGLGMLVSRLTTPTQR